MRWEPVKIIFLSHRQIESVTRDNISININNLLYHILNNKHLNTSLHKICSVLKDWQNDVAGFCCPASLWCPLFWAGRVSGLLSGQTPVSSTVPKIAQVRTGQHKEVLFGSPVPFQNNIKEWLCPGLKWYTKSKKTQQLPVLYKQKGWAGNTGSLYYILGNKNKKICCCYAETCRQDLWASEAHSYLQIVFLNSNQTVSDVVAYISVSLVLKWPDIS